MVFDFYTKKIKVFVASAGEDVLELHERLIKVLERAGMEVLCPNDGNKGNSAQNDEIESHLLLQADCSVHIIGNNNQASALEREKALKIKKQLEEAQNRTYSEWRDFKIFIWHPSNISDEQMLDDDFISSIRQGIMPNMIYSNRNSVVTFAEDIRSVMYSGKNEEFDTENTDLFFIYNTLDQEYALEITSFLSDVLKLKNLEIILSADIDYSELIVQQAKKSKMLVVYFKNTSTWATPFVQQIWKLTGGASSNSPILIIGDSNIPANHTVEFDANMVNLKLVAQEIIPIEIKVQFDKLIE